MKRMTVRQQEMLESFARDGEATDLDAFHTGNPLDWHNRERCSMFRSPHSCTKVAGDISPRGWSRFFEWKDDRTHALARREQFTRGG